MTSPISPEAVEAVVGKLNAQFGPGFSNGVSLILAHGDLPEHFGKECWADWQFKPADRAFEWAHDQGLIAPWKLSSKWKYTPLGLAVAAAVRTSLLSKGSDQ